jgi:hypothetical protein
MIAMAVITAKSECQTLAPVDISGFGKDRPLKAVFTSVSTSECRALEYLRAGQVRHDGDWYDVHIAAKLVFKNSSSNPVLLYKGFDPAMTGRVASSQATLAAGRYVTGFDGDRIATGHEPEKVTIDDFVLINPGNEYTSDARAMISASTNPQKPLHTPGQYWIELGIDARPSAFYYEPRVEKEFKRKWRSRGRVVDFILSEPFSIDVVLDPKAPPCTY